MPSRDVRGRRRIDASTFDALIVSLDRGIQASIVARRLLRIFIIS